MLSDANSVTARDCYVISSFIGQDQNRVKYTNMKEGTHLDPCVSPATRAFAVRSCILSQLALMEIKLIFT